MLASIKRIVFKLDGSSLKGCEFQNRSILRFMFCQLYKQIKVLIYKRIKNTSKENYAKIIK